MVNQNVTDITLERVRRIEEKLDTLSTEFRGFAREMRALFTGAVQIYQAVEPRLEGVESQLDRVLKRLEIRD